MTYALLVIEEGIPSTYKKGKIISELEMWKNAMLKEMKSFSSEWHLGTVRVAKGKVISCKWIDAKKYGSQDSEIIHYKARLVAKGYAQKESIYYNKVLSPIVKHSWIQILFALVAQYDLELY